MKKPNHRKIAETFYKGDGYPDRPTDMHVVLQLEKLLDDTWEAAQKAGRYAAQSEARIIAQGVRADLLRRLTSVDELLRRSFDDGQ